jgi:hypothetical protein
MIETRLCDEGIGQARPPPSRQRACPEDPGAFPIAFEDVEQREASEEILYPIFQLRIAQKLGKYDRGQDAMPGRIPAFVP